jgi:hypothetical protein
MLAIIIALGLLLLLTVYIGDVLGAVTFAFVLIILGWVLWEERKKSKEAEPS